MSRKYEAIDLMKLKSLGSANGWNEVLRECVLNGDINRLAKIKYQVSAGMDDLVKLKLNTEDMCVWFIRLTRSLENTAKEILRQKYPLPQDNALDKTNHTLKTLEAKRKRDHELQLFFKKSNY